MGENPSKFKEPVRPVELVTWPKAVEFCQRVSKRTRRPVRLPTEAEWEYACRAGTTGPHFFGPDESLDDYAWHRVNARGRTHPVGQKKPNPWGLYDIYGNVWEWCSDWYGADYYEKCPRENPRGPETGDRRMLRGGSWFYDIGFRCRSAFRHHNLPERGYHTLGFRAAVSAR
jgi:formylglycine-generating enzyme required for sulfatase activity